MRKLIAGMRVSTDGKVAGPEGIADWVEEWSDGYEVMPRVDACLIGGGMYPAYEQRWTARQSLLDKPLPVNSKLPTPAELEWARFARHIPHYVLSRTLTSALWPTTSFVRRLDELAALKQGPGKDIYLIGGARTAASLIDAGLVDELRLIVYPLIAGDGQALFGTTKRRRGLDLREARPLPGGRASLIYDVI